MRGLGERGFGRRAVGRVIAEGVEQRLMLAASVAQIANALDLPAGTVVSYSGDSEAVQSRILNTASGLLGFPSGRDEDFLLLSTGIASEMDTLPNDGDGQGTDLGGSDEEGDTATISFSLAVPDSSQTQKLRFDFIFLSEEYPEYVGSSYNDFFRATVNGTNIALDHLGNEVSVNNVFFEGNLSTAGTFFDGRTALVTATYTVPAGVSSLNIIFSTGDVGDGIYDSGVILDNVRFETSQRVWLNFEGQSGLSHGGATGDMPAFQPTDIDYANNSTRATVISEILGLVQGKYAGVDITFTTTRPASGDYSTVDIGGDDDALYGGTGTLFGQADHVDIGNRDRADQAVVFSREFGRFYDGESATQIRDRLAITIAHETAHNLGLRHLENAYNTDIMKKNSPRSSASLFSDEQRSLAAVENWPDGANTQNTMEYLRGVLGVPGQASFLGQSFNTVLNLINGWFTFTLDASLTIYDAKVGYHTGYTVDANGEVEADVAPQIIEIGDISGAAQLNLPKIQGQKFFLIGSSKDGGPVDITTGQLAANGQITVDAALIDYLDNSGGTVPSLSVYKKVGDALAPATTAKLAPSAYANITWLTKNTATYTDSDGDVYTVKLSGPGAIAVMRSALDGNGNGPISDIVLQGTDAKKSSLSIKVKKVGDGVVSIGAISGGSALKAINAAQSDITGSGIDFAGQFVGTMKLRDLRNGADITIGGSPALKSSITVAVVEDGSSITVGTTLSKLTAMKVGDGAVNAPVIGSFAVNGNKTRQVMGDLGADVLLTGPAGTTVLGKLSVKGLFSEATIRATSGNLGTLSLAAVDEVRVYAGYAGEDVPSSVGGFTTQAKINKLSVVGIKGQYSNASYLNVAAATIGSIAVNLPDIYSPIRIAADAIGKISGKVRQDDGSVRSESASKLMDPDDSFDDSSVVVTIF